MTAWCAMWTGQVTLGDLAEAHREYSARLAAGHPVLSMILERFSEVAYLVAPYCAIPRDYLSDTPPYCALWGFWCLNMANWVRYPLPLFWAFPPWRACKVEARYPPPQKGYLSDTCAIPFENKAKGVRYPPLRYYSGKVKRPANRQFRQLLGFSRGSLRHLLRHQNTIKQAFWVPWSFLRGDFLNPPFFLNVEWWVFYRLPNYLERVLRDMGGYLALGR